MQAKNIEQLVRIIYKCRLENDAEKCVGFFSPNATLRVAGLEQDPEKSCSDTLCELVAQWRFDKIENLEILVVQNKAVSRYVLHATFNPNRETLQVEVADWIRFDNDGLIVELVQHMDTMPLVKATSQ